ncbi:uncharacterized protein LOC131888655 isoform X2 [Tigriopus californicus]|uniref:uncharacterized protein LOC131888655 isoform X2 n=1 Tax=Tigriopus californicus TaxID=6832 RepID=UPI0027D9E7C1|nr:uncharacterized protein LOC131888655 isoform X2 [Tigriopus californicus]
MGSMAIQVLTVLLWIWGSTHLGSCAIPGANLAFEQTALQSSTSWSYRADLAVDGDKDTCSLTPRASEQRWWQVILPEDTQIQSVAVSVMAESEQEFTIFVIDLDDKNRTNFIKCDSFQGRMTRREMFQCPGNGLRGHKVYIRDDRKELNHLELCEVEIFGFYHSQEQIPCVPISIKNGQASYSKDEVTQQDMIDFVCDEGFVLWGSSQGKCLRNGIWEFNMKPSCNPMTCGEPPNLPNTHVVLQRENRNKTVAAELGDEAIYSCSGQLQMVKNGTYNAYIIEIKAVCSMDGTWRMDSFFSCLNQSEIVSDLVILESDHFVFWEWLLYFLMVLLIVVLLLVLFCALWRANQKRNSEKENTVVTRPRNMNNPYGTSTNYLLPSLNGKPGILKNESQFNENFEEDQNNQRGPSIDTTSSSLPEMRFNDDEPLEQPQNNSRQLPMSTFKPHQLYSGATNVSPTPNLYWSPDMHHNQYPNMSNWDLRVKAFPLEVAGPGSSFPSNYTPILHNNLNEPHQPYYTNLAEAAFTANPNGKNLPQIDEAGYASLIIKPRIIPRESGTRIHDQPHQYQNTQMAHNPLLGYPDLLKNTEENPYVNDEVIAANSAEMYAKIDLSKKRNSRREEDEDKEVDETLGQNHGEGAERVRPAQDRASQTPQPRVLEQDLINKFDRFFNTDQVSHC